MEGIAGATLEEKEAAAVAKWTRDLSSPDILRRGSGLDVQLGVVGIPRTEGFRVRESKRSVTCADTLHSKLQMEVAMQALAEHGTTSHALTSRAMGLRRSLPAWHGKFEFAHNFAAIASMQRDTATCKYCVRRNCLGAAARFFWHGCHNISKEKLAPRALRPLEACQRRRHRRIARHAE